MQADAKYTSNIKSIIFKRFVSLFFSHCLYIQSTSMISVIILYEMQCYKLIPLFAECVSASEFHNFLRNRKYPTDFNYVWILITNVAKMKH